MATKQYRWTGFAYWHSQSGNAIIAIQNNVGSNKRVIINSFELYSKTKGATTGYAIINLVRGTVSGGNTIPLVSMDTEATIPDGISVKEECTTTISDTIKRVVWYKIVSQAGNGIVQRINTSKIKDEFNSVLQVTDVEPIVIRPSESISLYVSSKTSSHLLCFSGKIVIRGSPNRTYMYNKIIPITADQQCILSFVNESISDIFEIKTINIQEIGTLDTPYLQLVPIGAINAEGLSDSSRSITPMPMDTEYGALDSNICKIVMDTPLLPYGVPVSYISESSTATPKGYNYLNTKDYVGPSFFNVFPEFNTKGATVATQSDARLLGISNKLNSLITKNNPIILRPGEALGLVSAAETAVVTTAIGTSGWMVIELGLTCTIAPIVDPILSITNLSTGSDIVILEAGTSTELLNVDSHAGSTYDWEYDADDVSEIDLCIYKAGYIPYIVRNYSPGALGGSIPVAQVIDRAYLV